MKRGHVTGNKKEKSGGWNWYDTPEAQEILRKLEEKESSLSSPLPDASTAP